MPSDIVTPVQLRWGSGTITTNAEIDTVLPLRLVWSSGTVAEGLGAGVTTSVAVPELDRLTRFDQLFDDDGTPSVRFMAIWQEFAEKIEAAFASQQGQITDLSAIVNRLAAAEALASAANDNAVNISNSQDLASSYTDPPQVLSASNEGVITIADHGRVYPVSRTRAEVEGGTLSGFSSGDYVSVFYSDAARAGGAVDYQGSTSPVAQSGNVHVVGQVLVPEAGEPPVSGNSPSAPGYTPRPGGVNPNPYEVLE